MSGRILSWLGLLTMTACSASPEIRYYTLSADPGPQNTPTTTTRLHGAPYEIDAIVIPELQDRPEIVLRSGANTVEVLDDDRWAAPLADQLQRVLAADLASRLGADAIIEPGLPSAPRTSRRITVSILEFDPGRGDSVIEASWEISDDTRSAPVGGATKTYRARHAASTSRSDVTGIVAAMSSLMTLVADDIASTLTASE
jgi:uncharacterized lipoprotein YmbA